MVVLITNSDLIENKYVKQLKTFIKNQAYFFKYLLNAEDVGSDKSISKIRTFGEEIILVAKFAALFFVAILLFTAPIYIMKLLGFGESHSLQYGWLFNLVYMRGEAIAVVMMFAWIGLIVLLFFIYYKCDMKRLQAQHGEAAKKKSVHAMSNEDIFGQPEKTFDYKICMQYLFLGLLNLVIVVIVNGSYIYSTYQDFQPSTTFYIQIGLALFKMLYNKCVPILTLHIRDVTTNIAVRSLLNIFNNLFIPCVATAFTSPACYQVDLPNNIFHDIH
jgi:hypothetical protein